MKTRPSLPERKAPLDPRTRGREKNGVVYTKSWVVDLILDLVGYTEDKPLASLVLTEPAAGDGSFLLRAADRLANSCDRFGVDLRQATGAIVSFELEQQSADKARTSLRSLLEGRGLKSGDAEVLSDCWVRTGDFLLDQGSVGRKSDFVVGNPPYVRLEDLEGGGAKYRSKFLTMVGRSDIYVAFYEKALQLLKPGGACGFICADRWMFNQYGAELRKFITTHFCVETIVQMHHADAFESEVSAYPAVTIIRNAPQGSVVVASLDPAAEGMGATELLSEIQLNGSGKTNASRITNWFSGSSPWPLIEPHKLALLKRIESEFSTLESTGATVGIGVATGADRVFITQNPDLVESERLLPLAMAHDLVGTGVKWSGHFLVNPWNGSGLVNLPDFPQLAEHLLRHRDQLAGRHVGQKVPANWYRTIDRVTGSLTKKHKLYLPDIKGRIAPALDRGETYPHHNLYFVEPGLWDAEVLGGLLLSNVAQFFIEAYGVRMRGGYLRFQAQYLRRLCVPLPQELSSAEMELLREAFAQNNVQSANEIAAKVYRLTDVECNLLGH